MEGSVSIFEFSRCDSVLGCIEAAFCKQIVVLQNVFDINMIYELLHRSQIKIFAESDVAILFDKIVTNVDKFG